MKTKRISFLFPLLLMCSGIYSLTVKQQLQKINSNWTYRLAHNKQLDKDITFNTEKELIQFHLRLVEQTLRAKRAQGLNHEQKSLRNKMLNTLHKYCEKGVFPKNTKHPVNTPYFIDYRGVACAVGYMIIKSGEMQLAERISIENNNGYIFDLAKKYPQIGVWAYKFGFEMEELAWIQPCYSPSTPTVGINQPTCHNARNGYFYPDLSQLQGPLTKTFSSLVNNAWAPKIDYMCGYWAFYNLEQGKYKWEVKDSQNFTHTFSVELTSPPPATVTLIKSGDFNSCNGTITASVQGGVSPFSYYWWGKTETKPILTSVCEESITLTFNENGPGCYQLFQLITWPLGVAEQSKDIMQFSPNPVSNILHLKINQALHSENKTLVIVDIHGRTVIQTDVINELTDINVSELPSGIYSLQFDGSPIQRIVKE